MVKAKKDCGFNYLLSHKAASKDSEEKRYIRTLKCLTYTHKLHLNPFSFERHEKSTIEYQALVVQVEAERIANKDKTRAAAPEKEVERVPNSPERPSTPLSRKRTNTLVSLLLLRHYQYCNIRQNRPNQLSHFHLRHQLYYTKGREEKSGRGRLNLRRQAGWQSRTSRIKRVVL
jgi:hypothetical protein